MSDWLVSKAIPAVCGLAVAAILLLLVTGFGYFIAYQIVMHPMCGATPLTGC